MQISKEWAYLDLIKIITFGKSKGGGLPLGNAKGIFTYVKRIMCPPRPFSDVI
jgi:hypothetical protein